MKARPGAVSQARRHTLPVMETATAKLLEGAAPEAPDRIGKVLDELVAPEPFWGRKVQDSSLDLAEALVHIGQELLAGAPPADRLDRARDLIIGACVACPWRLISHRDMLPLLGDLLRERDDATAVRIGESLIRAGVAVEAELLPRDQPQLVQMCLTLLDLEPEELAELEGVTPDTIRRRLERKGRYSPLEKDLAYAGYWLSRRGLGSQQAREWFENPNPRLKGESPRRHVEQLASPYHSELARTTRAELLAFYGVKDA